MMVESALGIFLVTEKFIDFVYVFPYFGEVERPEVLEEAFVGEILGCMVRMFSMLKKNALGIYFGGLDIR